MVNRKANEAEKQFIRDMTDWVNDVGIGVLYAGYGNRTDIQRHHVLGKSAKHNKVHIGYNFVLPIPIELHDVNSNHELNVTHHKKCFIKEFGKQCDIYNHMVTMMKGYGYAVPSLEVHTAIMSTNA